ncbi:MAG TPA: hypothetical protein VFI65_04350 [Streptosporangiaceae bacterium]|nr:hypothetical protein [Streptosporangiaceae bacterium]
MKRTELRTGEQLCKAVGGNRDHRAEVTMIGTAITQFTRDRRASQRPSLAVLSLDPERRAAARRSHARLDHPQTVQVLEADRHNSEQDAFNASEEQR